MVYILVLSYIYFQNSLKLRYNSSVQLRDFCAAITITSVPSILVTPAGELLPMSSCSLIPPHPQPLATTTLFLDLSLWISLLWILHINAVI